MEGRPKFFKGFHMDLESFLLLGREVVKYACFALKIRVWHLALDNL